MKRSRLLPAAPRTGQNHRKASFARGPLAILCLLYLGSIATLALLDGAHVNVIERHFWLIFAVLHILYGNALALIRKRGAPNGPADPAGETRDGAWFAPKQLGYGTGLPVSWQGWLVYGLYIVVVLGLGFWRETGGDAAHIAGLVLILLATGLLVVICAKKTRGGWKWRWGKGV